MSAVLFKYVCGSCGTEFLASGAPEMSYGEFVLRSESGEEVYLEAMSNLAFNEVSKIVKAHPSFARADQNKVGDIIQKVFGVACDFSPCGQQFYIEMMPTCPLCSSREMASWGEVYPQQLSPIPSATQSRWASMSGTQKSDFIDCAINRVNTTSQP